MVASENAARDAGRQVVAGAELAVPGACDGRERAPGARVVTVKTGVGGQADTVEAEVLGQGIICAEVRSRLDPSGKQAIQASIEDVAVFAPAEAVVRPERAGFEAARFTA